MGATDLLAAPAVLPTQCANQSKAVRKVHYRISPFDENYWTVIGGYEHMLTLFTGAHLQCPFLVLRRRCPQLWITISTLCGAAFGFQPHSGVKGRLSC